MTQAQHTPGPWYADDAAENSHLAACMIENPSWIAIEDTAPDGGHLAYCHPNNARLIAAAPELLAALDALINMPSDMTAERVTALNAASAAIAKAKGV